MQLEKNSRKTQIQYLKVGWFDSYFLRRQFFSHVGMEPPFPGYNQYFLGLKDTSLSEDQTKTSIK